MEGIHRSKRIISDEYLHSKLCSLISKLVVVTEKHVNVITLGNIKLKIQMTLILKVEGAGGGKSLEREIRAAWS